MRLLSPPPSASLASGLLALGLLLGAAGCGQDPLDDVHLPGEAGGGAATGGSVAGGGGVADPNGPGAPGDTIRRADAVLEVVAAGLEIPWDLAATPDGRLLVTERPGRVRVVGSQGLQPRPWATFDVHARDPSWHPESGLLGIDLAPDYDRSRHVYVYGVFRKGGLAGSGGLPGRIVRRLRALVDPYGARPFVGRVYRLTDAGDHATDPELVVDGLPAFHYHAGGALAFGPDGMLYLSTGDARLPDASADPDALAGRILRYRPDGTVPDDNPDPGSPVWARGFRNPQGLAWTADGSLVAIEHGPSGFPNEGGRVGNDELDRVRPGGDYGWPRVTGDPGEREGGDLSPDPFEAPLRVWDPSLAPAGLAYRPVTGEDGGDGDLLVTGLQRRGQLRRIRLGTGPNGGVEVVEEEVLLEDGLGRLRLVAVGPDGAVYLGTSNRSARGRAREGDDRVFRVLRFLEPPADGASPP